MEKTNLHRFLQGIALVQQISNQFLSDRKLWRQFYATLDRVWVTAIQELWSIKTVILPAFGSWRNITNKRDKCLKQKDYFLLWHFIGYVLVIPAHPSKVESENLKLIALMKL